MNLIQTRQDQIQSYLCGCLGSQLDWTNVVVFLTISVTQLYNLECLLLKKGNEVHYNLYQSLAHKSWRFEIWWEVSDPSVAVLRFLSTSRYWLTTGAAKKANGIASNNTKG